MDAQTILVAAGTGLGSGAVGSLFAPWSQWGVEKRKEKLLRRRRSIDEWRVFAAHSRNLPSKIDITAQHPYVSLRGYLSPEARGALEGTSTDYITVDSGIDYYIDLLINEIDRIEKEWKLR